jgi:hypothetical protein
VEHVDAQSGHGWYTVPSFERNLHAAPNVHLQPSRRFIHATHRRLVAAGFSLRPPSRHGSSRPRRGPYENQRGQTRRPAGRSLDQESQRRPVAAGVSLRFPFSLWLITDAALTLCKSARPNATSGGSIARSGIASRACSRMLWPAPLRSGETSLQPRRSRSQKAPGSLLPQVNPPLESDSASPAGNRRV